MDAMHLSGRVRQIPGLVVVAVCAGLCAGCAAEAPKPRLTVVMVVDMLPAEALERYGPYLSDGGLKRLISEGAWFKEARFSHGNTHSAPGHATIATGTSPSRHGIVGDTWYIQGQREPVEAARDPLKPLVGLVEASIGFSPHLMQAPTLGDAMKEQIGEEARVWACSLKDVAAVMTAGHLADGAIFWLEGTGDFISSFQYCFELPAYIESLNTNRLADQYFHATWDRVAPASIYGAVCDVDGADYERGRQIYWNNTFPKKLGRGFPVVNEIFWKHLLCSPYGNEMVFEVARRIVEHENLGKDETPDLLTVSLSSNDLVGNMFGTRSHEYFDMFLRTDREIADWLSFLDKEVGLEHCSIVLTSDHGVCPPPEWSQARGEGGGRVKLTEVFAAIHDALTEKYGPASGDRYYAMAVATPWITLHEAALLDAGADLEEAAAIAAEAARSMEAVGDAFSLAALRKAPREALTDVQRMALDGAFEDRSGHIYMQLTKNYFRTSPCAGHGSAHDYDTHVPLIFFGKQFKKGQYTNRVDMRDLAPTLSAAMGIRRPAKSDGRALTEALRVKPVE
jgi:arylsulfatase A-like enzyme